MPFIDGRQMRVGDTIHFYNIGTYASDGSAKIANLSSSTDELIAQNYANALGELGLANSSTKMLKVTLDRDVNLTSVVELADIEEVSDLIG